MSKYYNMKETLSELLSTRISGVSAVTGEDINFSPSFRIAVQEILKDGSVRIIVHADGYNSNTLDFLVKDNKLKQT